MENSHLVFFFKRKTSYHAQNTSLHMCTAVTSNPVTQHHVILYVYISQQRPWHIDFHVLIFDLTMDRNTYFNNTLHTVLMYKKLKNYNIYPKSQSLRLLTNLSTNLYTYLFVLIWIFMADRNKNNFFCKQIGKNVFCCLYFTLAW